MRTAPRLILAGRELLLFLLQPPRCRRHPLVEIQHIPLHAGEGLLQLLELRRLFGGGAWDPAAQLLFLYGTIVASVV